MAEQKTLNTRLSLRIDKWDNWNKWYNTDGIEVSERPENPVASNYAQKGAWLVLKPGEVAFVQVNSIPPSAAESDKTSIDTVLFKVGDGETPFYKLAWGSALAADVYSWAKKTDIEFCKWLSGDNELTEAVTFVTNATFTETISGLEAVDLSLGNRIAVLESMAGIGSGEGDSQDGLASITYVDSKFDAEAKARADADEQLGEDLAGVFAVANEAKQLATDNATAISNLGNTYATKEQLNSTTQNLTGLINGKVDNSAYTAKVGAIDKTIEAINGEIDGHDTKIATIEGQISNLQDQDTAHGKALSGLEGRVAGLETASATHAVESSVAERLAGKVDNATYVEDKAALAAEDLRLAGLINSTDEKLTAFLTSKDAQDTAVNTLVEIQEYITSHGTEAAGMLDDIAANADAIERIDGEVDALEQNLTNETKEGGNRDLAIKAAIEALDVDPVAIAEGETIKSISEVDGKIAVEKQAIRITKSQISDFGSYADKSEFDAHKEKAITTDVELIINCGSSTTNIF